MYTDLRMHVSTYVICSSRQVAYNMSVVRVRTRADSLSSFLGGRVCMYVRTPGGLVCTL